MEKFLVDVYLPAVGDSFEVSIPCSMNCMVAAQLTARALAELSDGSYLPPAENRPGLFAWRANGEVLDIKKSMEEAQVKNGSRLLLL